MNKIGRWFALAISCFLLGHTMYQFSLGFDLGEIAAGVTAWVPMAFVAIAVTIQIVCNKDQVATDKKQVLELAKLDQRKREWQERYDPPSPPRPPRPEGTPAPKVQS